MAAVMECTEVYAYLGDCYLDGEGTEVNLMGTYKCYRESHRAGHLSGSLKLAELYMKGIYVEKDYNTALYMFTEASLKGSLDAVEHLAEIYKASDFNRRDEYMSLIYAEAGAKYGSNVCKEIAGDYYLIYANNDDDIKQAYNYYKSMTECKGKYYSLGNFYEISEGINSINVYIDCYKKALEMGDERAAYALARIYGDDTIYQDLEKAEDYYNRYLEMGGKENIC